MSIVVHVASRLTSINYYYFYAHLTASFPEQYQKGKTSLNLNEGRDDGAWGWQWHQLDHMQTICTSSTGQFMLCLMLSQQCQSTKDKTYFN